MHQHAHMISCSSICMNVHRYSFCKALRCKIKMKYNRQKKLWRHVRYLVTTCQVRHVDQILMRHLYIYIYTYITYIIHILFRHDQRLSALLMIRSKPLFYDKKTINQTNIWNDINNIWWWTLSMSTLAMWRGRPCLRAWQEPRAETTETTEMKIDFETLHSTSTVSTVSLLLQGPGLHVARLPFGQPPNGCWESQLSLKMRDFFWVW